MDEKKNNTAAPEAEAEEVKGQAGEATAEKASGAAAQDMGSEDAKDAAGNADTKAHEAEDSKTSESDVAETEEDAAGTEADATETESEAAESTAEAAKDNKEEGKSRKFWKKSDKKADESAAKLAAANAQIAELNDSVRRNLAEFDNYRKRTDKEKAARFEMGQRNVVEKMLPVVDNFERGLATLPEDKLTDPFAEGMSKTYKQLLKALEELGVKPIEAVGQPFNPDFHNAVMHVDDESVGENIIVEEFQKGYTMNDAVVRYSMVKVAN